MGKIKFLSKAEVRELIKRSQEGDEDARATIVEKNTRLVWNAVQRFKNRGYELDDLFQLGVIGLLKSIDKFNFDYDVQFSTYAVPMIIGEIQRFIRDDGTVKVPRTIKELANKIHKEDLYKETPAVIIEKLGLENTSVEYINTALRYLKEKGGQVLSTDETVYENDGDPITIGDLMGGDVNGTNWLNNIALRQAITKLDEREQKIVQLRYYQDRTQSETASALGISQVQVSRLEKQILLKMKDGFNEEEQPVATPAIKVNKAVVSVGEVKKQKEEETIDMGNNKNAKGNREEAIRLLESTELTYKEIAARTEVPLSTIGGLAGTYRSKAVKNKNRAKNAPRKGSKKSKNKETMKKKSVATQAPPVQTTPPIQLAKPVVNADGGFGIWKPAPQLNGWYTIGGGEPSPYMQKVEEQGKELATELSKHQPKNLQTMLEDWRDEEVAKALENEKNKAKVEYNFNFNVSGKMVSKEEVIKELDKLTNVLKMIDIDTVNFRINVGS